MEVPVKAGDFFDVPAGTIHAIVGARWSSWNTANSNTIIVDYDRRDAQGNPRDHILAGGGCHFLSDPGVTCRVKTQQVEVTAKLFSI